MGFLWGEEVVGGGSFARCDLADSKRRDLQDVKEVFQGRFTRDSNGLLRVGEYRYFLYFRYVLFRRCACLRSFCAGLRGVRGLAVEVQCAV